MKAKHKEAGNKTVDTDVEPTRKTIVVPISGANKEIEIDEPSQEVLNMIKCDYCEKSCKNAGSMKLHMKAKHLEILDAKLETGKAKDALELQESEKE